MTGLTPPEMYKVVEKFVGREGASGMLGFTHKELTSFLKFDAELDAALIPPEDGTSKGNRLMAALEKSSPGGQARIIEAVLQAWKKKQYKFRFETEDLEKQRSRLAPELEQLAEKLRAPEAEIPHLASTTSSRVKQALEEGRTLLRDHGPNAALDRLHTAIMASMQELLAQNGEPVPKDGSMTQLYGLLRKTHPAFVLPTEVRPLGDKMQRGVASALEALNEMRNDWSRAHPNDSLPPNLALLGVDFATLLLRDFDRRLP